MSDLLNKASLVMVPSGYKEDTVYSVVPTDGSGDLSFTRASNGTRVNSAGLVEVAPWNLLFDTNTLSSWSLEGGTLTSGFTAPDGSSTAYKYVQTTGGLYSVGYAETAGNKTVTIWLKSVSGTSMTCQINDGNLGNSTILTVTNEWQLFTVVYTTATSRPSIYIYSISNAQGIYVWHPQLNIGSTAKPYFPTTDRLNVPRLTYQNGGGGCPSLLLEKQSTNELSYSEEFDNAAWSVKDNLSVTANATTSPDGTQNADKLVENSSNDQHRIYRSGNGTNKMFSFFAKASERSWVSVLCNNGNFTWFDLANGQVGTVAATSTATIENVGNGWYRCAVYNTHGSFGSLIQIATANNVTSYQGNGTSGIFVWGAQLEASSYATSYIPTTSSSATRVADYVSRSGLALTNSTFAVNFKPLDYVVELFDFQKTGGGRMFYIAVQSNGYITFNSVSGGTIGAIGSILPKNQTCKLAFTLNASTSDLTVFINGSKIGTYATNITTFGAFFGLQSFGYNPGTQIEQIAIFPSVLTDAECISLTS